MVISTKNFLLVLCFGALLVSCSSSLDTDVFFNGAGGGFGRIGSSALTITPVSTTFAPIQTFTTSAPSTVTVKNTSNFRVFLTSLASPSSPHFSIQSTTCPLGPSNPLDPGVSCTIDVVFNPTAVGQLDYGMPVNYNGGSATQSYTTAAALTGIGATNVVFAGVTSVDNLRARSVRLNWTDVPNENGYALFTVVGSTLTFWGTVPKDSTSGTVSGLLPSTANNFRVRAFDFFGGLELNTTDVSATTLPDPVLTGIPHRTYAATNPLPVTNALVVDVDNTLTSNDVNIAYGCTFDTVVDGTVAAGTNCSSLPGMALSGGFAGVVGGADGNGQFTYTPPLTEAGKAYEIRISGNDSSVEVERVFAVNVKASYLYNASLLLGYEAENATGTSPGINSPFTSTWVNLAPTGSLLDGSLASGLFATGWLGAGVWVTNPYRLSFAGTSGATADRVISSTNMNGAANLMFTSWVYPTNTGLGTTAYVFGNRDTTTSGWSVRQRSEGTYEFVVGNGATGSYSSAITGLSPAAYFKFDELAGLTTLDEVSASNLTVTNSGSVTRGGTGAYAGSTSFRFTGNGVVLLPTPIDITANWSVASWIKMPLPVDGNWKTLVRGNASDHPLIFEAGTNVLGSYVSSTGQNFISSGLDADTLSAGWHHFAAVGTGTHTRWYVDGVYINQVLGTTATDFYAIGNYQIGGQPVYEIDDLALFTSTLTDDQINQIYLGGCSTTLAQNSWANVAGRFNGTLAELYKNGAKVCDYTPTGTITGSPDSFTVGARADGTQAWPGVLGNLFVYNSGTGANILTNFNAHYDQFGFAPSCAEWLARGYTSNGTYTIDPDGSGGLAPMTVECDMTTDGGGWTMVLNYLHQGGTNPAISARTTSFPIIGSSALGVNESAVTASWGHAAPSLLTNLSYSTTRYYCATSLHPRVFHVKSSSASCKTYFNTGVGNCTDLSSTFTALSGHSANTPAVAFNGFFSSQGNSAMTEFPFYVGSTYHWGIRGLGGRWECDDFAGGSGSNTLHRLWVR